MQEFDPYHQWLGIRSTERPPNHYRLLGIDLLESDPDVIRLAADRQMAYVQKCANGPHQGLSQKLLNELSAARVCLLSPNKRRIYDRQLKQRLGTGPSDAKVEQQAALQVAIESFDKESPYSARLKNKNKNALSIPLIVTALALVTGFAVFQMMGKPVSTPIPATVIARSENDTPQDQSKPLRDERVEEIKQQQALAAARPVKDVPAAASVTDVGDPEEKTTVTGDAAAAMPTEKPAAPEVAASVAISEPVVSVDPSSNKRDQSQNFVENDDKTSGPATKKPKPTPAKKSKGKVKSIDILDLPGARFEVVVSRDEKSSSSTESTGGRPLSTELTRGASDANQQCEEFAKKWSIEFTEWNVIASTLGEKQAQMLESGSAVKRLDDLLVPMKDRPRFSNDPVTIQQEKLEEQRNNANNIYEARKSEITTGVARINELNTSLQAVQEQWRQTWNQLNSSRREWLELAQPLKKYAHGDFEGARELIDNWLENDDLWLEGHCWAAVCAYELGDYPAALVHVERAEKLCTVPYRTKRQVSQICATRALIVVGLPQQRSKSDGLVLKAMSEVDKQNDWQTHFIVGRAAMELGRQAKAKAMFGQAIGINPTGDCTNYWLGCLQTTSSDPSVKDLNAGTKLLESLWSNSDKQSWRVSFALVRAYDAEKRTDEAERQWKTTLTLAPAAQHDELMKQRNR